MQSTIRLLVFVSVLAASVAGAAAQDFDPKARAKKIAPFIDEQTIGVVRLDLTQLEIDPFFDRLKEVPPNRDLASPEARTGMKEVQEALRKAGVEEICLVVHLADLPRRPFSFYTVAPLDEGVDAEALIASLPPPGRDQVLEPLDGALFLGDPRALERVKTAKPDPRPDMVTAFAAAGDTVAQLLFLPPPHAQRVIEEIMPDLPEEIGGGSSTILTRGLLWAVVGVEVLPDISLQLVIQSRDARTATALRGKWLDLVKFLSANEEVRRRLSGLDDVSGLLSPNVEDDRLVLNLGAKDGSIAVLLATVAPPFEAARAHAKRTLSSNNLKQCALAMHNYHDKYKKFPPVGNADDQGNLLLSWRVHLLPFTEQNELYKEFHLDEPWDSPHNRKLIEKMPEMFRCPASGLRAAQGLSTYRVVSAEGTVFPGREGVPINEIKDGTSHTIMITEVDDAHAVVWTKPEGFSLDPEDPVRGLGGHFKNGFNTAFCDGSVRFISKTIDPEILRALFTRAGREVIAPD